MSKKSAAAKATLPIGEIQELRLDAPDYLTEEQRVVWLNIVNALPADWFNYSHRPMLARYCRAIVAFDKNAVELNRAQERKRPNPEQVRKLQKAEANFTKEIITLGRTMRLTQQAVIYPRSGGTSMRKSRMRSLEEQLRDAASAVAEEET